MKGTKYWVGGRAWENSPGEGKRYAKKAEMLVQREEKGDGATSVAAMHILQPNRILIVW